MYFDEVIKKRLQESINVKKKILTNNFMCKTIEEISQIIIKTFKNGGKVILCGNGGSASDALHIAGELVGRFRLDRDPLPAIALNSDVAIMTSISNDYGYEYIFSRQVKCLMTNNDVLIGISTSGNSKNIINAILTANEIGGATVALLGKEGGIIKNISDISLTVPSEATAHIQESHITIGHIICEIVESAIQNDLHVNSFTTENYRIEDYPHE